MDIQLRKTRDHQATYMFMKRLVIAFGEPTVLTTDKASALLCALKKLKHNGFYYTVKHFNNLIEKDHRHIKRRFAKSTESQNLRHASRTIKEIEIIHALYKRNRSSQLNCGFSTYKELYELLVNS
ncbi:hypothetical protein bcgnr5386_54000 [Bacillus cereus]